MILKFWTTRWKLSRNQINMVVGVKTGFLSKIKFGATFNHADDSFVGGNGQIVTSKIIKNFKKFHGWQK